MMRFVLRHAWMDVVVYLAILAIGAAIVRGLTDSDGFAFAWTGVAAAVYVPILSYLNSRRRREWRELGIPDPALRSKPSGAMVNGYPVTPAGRRRGRVYLGLLLVTVAVVAMLALLDLGPWAGAVAALAMMAGALAGFVVFARGFRAGD